MSYLWLLILNIMIPIIACTAISRVGNATYLAWRTRCLLRSSGGPVNLKKIAKAGLLAVEWGQQAWAGWGGRSY